MASRYPALCSPLLLALALAGCGNPPNFTVPVCSDVNSSACYCYQAGFIVCGNTCVDARFDAANCGACGKSCGGRVCVHGTCAASCGTLSECGGRCSDPATDPYNCGTCGNSCDGGCNGGVCGSTPKQCYANNEFQSGQFTSCNGACVDLDGDSANCGGCGIACNPTSQKCQSGTCTGLCPIGETPCSDVGDTISCVDTYNDPENCGSCGNSCNGDCFDGACQ